MLKKFKDFFCSKEVLPDMCLKCAHRGRCWSVIESMRPDSLWIGFREECMENDSINRRVI